ncbi:DNA-binding transcriptional LysR family regulator [Kribbella amoyensis]|uniref:DNA-binding transcriptional LysR family regulator n=1 Tax=Kribbella amoyensis TaxID=996641 RepID=A0A561BZR9_9ACTN|nr:LysR family transcriptional regulator [Kribbella amoyensis]TWD84360.1 DNA-binding transcriptional LysR family regulator [Kribbella amoyensis]
MELELRHLRVVCRLADSGSVSKAAAALGVSQPSLTAQLHRIEDAIGGPLFERGPQGVAPTPLGKHVLGRARSMLADMDELVGSSRRYTAGPGPLRIGSVRTVMFGAWLSRLEELLPDRELSTQVDTSFAVLTELLAAGVVDVVMLGRCDDAHAPPCPPGIVERTMVYPEPFAIALPANHRLASSTEIRLEQLAEDTWICPPAGKEDGDLAALRDSCEAVGFTPRFRYSNLDSSEIEQLIGEGRGVSPCAPTVRRIPSAVIRPLVGRPLLWRRALRWRPEAITETDVNRIHQAFVDTYRSTLAETAALHGWWAEQPGAHPTIHDPED